MILVPMSSPTELMAVLDPSIISSHRYNALWVLYLVSPKGLETQHSSVGELILHGANSDP